MFCPKCGSALETGGRFCPSCGFDVTSGGAPGAQPAGVQTAGPGVATTAPKKKKSILPIILIIVFGFLGLIIVGILAVFFLVFKVVDSAETKLVCTSPEGSITISFNDTEITGYHANGITYDLDGQKELSRQYGVDSYMEQFTDWFEKNTSGTCVREGESSSTHTPTAVDDDTKDDPKPSSSMPDLTTRTVGQANYGYVDIPSNWVTFQDVEDNTALQYSYGTDYIISIDYVRNPQGSAKDYASSFAAQKKNDSRVEGVTGATVEIGKTKKYTAYQVYMYYPADKAYLITYWFETGDGYVHYLALEGPEGVEDYLSIPKSFRTTK